MAARHEARKRFGQHFLVDQRVIQDIVRAIDPKPEEHVVEIGPGLGALTAPLAARLPRLCVIELDRDLAARLLKRPALEVIQADVLTVDFAQLAVRLAGSGGRLRVVGNLPYNVSSPILFHLLPQAEHVVDQHFMLQREVVQRMVATPASGDYGRLSVMLQWRYAMESVLEVPPEAFDPPPRVHSAVVRMVPRAEPQALQPTVLQELVAVAFSQRRKLLRHTLGVWLAERGHTGAFDVQRRAEEVPVHEYLRLAAALSVT